MQRNDIEWAHGRVATLESNAEGPALILAHGNSTSAALYRDLLAGPIGQRYRAIALDWPGHGESERSRDGARDYTIAGLSTVLEAVVSTLAPRPCVLVGHSLGGHIMTATLGRLSNVAGLLLVSAPPLRADALGRIFRPDPTGGALFRADLSPRDVEAFAAALLHPAVAHDDLMREVQNAIRATDPDFRRQLGGSVAAGAIVDEVSVLATTRVPTALVYGTDDAFLDVSYYPTVELGSPWRGGSFPLPGSGHSPHLSSTQRFGELLRAFIDDCLS